MIVIGPGSLYTSLLPNLLVHDLLGALHASRALKVYACNIATQTGETDTYSVYDHMRGNSVKILNGCSPTKRLWPTRASIAQTWPMKIIPGGMIHPNWQKN